MSGKIVYLLCILFCVGACSDDRFSDSSPAVSAPLGEEIPVSLSLGVAPLLSPLSGTTRTGADGSGLQASFSGMEVELSGKPVVDTRTLTALDDSKLSSVFILQFDGVTSQSKSVQIKYISAGNDGKINLDGFTFRDTGGRVSRVVVIANLDAGYFNLEEWGTSGSKTYQDLLKLFIQKKEEGSDIYPLYNASQNPKNRALMFGQIDAKIETGKLVTVVLQRIFAKASFDIEISETLKGKYSIWQARLSNLPTKCYLAPVGRKKPFPSLGDLGLEGYYDTPVVKAENGIFNSADLSAYLPVHLQPEVETATEKTRTLVAPVGSSYLQIIGLNMSETGLITDQIIYQIYLGNNFTTDYTVSPNTFYKYTIRVKNDDPQDGTIIKFIPGYWGGKLKAYDKNGAEVAFTADNAVKWQYEKQIEVYPVDLLKPKLDDKNPTKMFWGPVNCNMKGATSLTDGRKNTWNIHESSPIQDYAASFVCYRLNGNTVTSENGLKWYLPSLTQLVGTYIVCSNLLSTLSQFYWSSTGYTGTGQAYYVNKDGKFFYGVTNWGAYVRAVKDVEPVN